MKVIVKCWNQYIVWGSKNNSKSVVKTCILSLLKLLAVSTLQAWWKILNYTSANQNPF